MMRVLMYKLICACKTCSAKRARLRVRHLRHQQDKLGGEIRQDSPQAGFGSDVRIDRRHDASTISLPSHACPTARTRRRVCAPASPAPRWVRLPDQHKRSSDLNRRVFDFDARSFIQVLSCDQRLVIDGYAGISSSANGMPSRRRRGTEEGETACIGPARLGKYPCR